VGRGNFSVLRYNGASGSTPEQTRNNLRGRCGNLGVRELKATTFETTKFAVVERRLRALADMTRPGGTRGFR
jgi:hypothetical protein